MSGWPKDGAAGGCMAARGEDASMVKIRNGTEGHGYSNRIKCKSCVQPRTIGSARPAFSCMRGDTTESKLVYS